MTRSNYWIRRMNSSRLSRRRFVGGAAAAGAATASLALVGCGDDDDDDDDAGTSPTQGGSESPAASPTGGVSSNLPDHPMYRGLPGGQRGGKYVFGQPDAPVGRDPHAYEIPGTHALVDPVYNGLFLLWPDDPTNPTIMGELVEDWEQVSETEVVFNIRKGVLFQDVAPVSGREFTAEDVEFNIRRMQDPRAENRLSGFYTPIETVEVVDTHTVRLGLSTPFAPLLTNLAFNWAMMLARELDEAGEMDTRAIGTGAYVLDNYEQGVGATWSAHPNYWKPGLPLIPEMEMQIIPDPAVREAKFLAGEIDNGSVSTLGSNEETIQSKMQDIRDRVGADTNFRETESSFVSILHVSFNTTHAPFDNIEIRRAFAHGFPYDVLVNDLMAGRGIRTGPVSSGNAYWAVPEEDLPVFDPELAAELLATNGYPDGLEVESWVSPFYSGTALAPLVAGLYQSTTNIRITPRPMENAQWIADVYRGGADYPITTHADATFDDPDRILYEYYHSTGAQNNKHVNDPELDRMAEAQRQELDREARQQLVIEMQKYIMDQAYEVPLASPGGISAFPPWLTELDIRTGISDSRRVRDVQYITGGPRGS